MKTLTDFVLKEEYKHLQSVLYKLAEIHFVIDWKSFHIIFASMHLDKTVLGGKPEDDIRFML
jgi:IS5 family transposase